jgi:DNA-binding FrmR family transcriptional regulator
MGHTLRDVAKLLGRVRRIKGQCDAIERALENADDCNTTLQLIAGARGAMNGLMAELLEEHLVTHVLNGQTARARDVAAGDLVSIVRTYLK